MVRTCKVEKSPHCEEYERLWKENNYKYQQLANLAREKFNENISAMTFYRHMTQHLIMKEMDQISEFEIGEIEEDPLVSLKISFEELNSIISIAKQIFEKRPSPPALTSLTNAYDKKRSILESIERFERQRKSSATTSERIVLEELLWASDQLCPECTKKLSQIVTERLKKIGTMDVNNKA